jgi:hypothetical protein
LHGRRVGVRMRYFYDTQQFLRQINST